MKIRIFSVTSDSDRLPTREQILTRKGPTNGLCPLCTELESIDHLLFHCPVAIFVWLLIKECVGWPDAPHSVMDLLSLVRYVESKNRGVIWIGAAATLWALGTIRNKLIF